MLYCILTDHAVSRQVQYLVQRLLTFYTEPYYIPVMGNQQLTGYAGAKHRVNSAKEKLQIYYTELKAIILECSKVMCTCYSN
jgi:hypothetical protein